MISNSKFTLVFTAIVCMFLGACQKSGGDSSSTPEDTLKSEAKVKTENSPPSTHSAETQTAAASSFSEFIPSGYSPLDTAYGELNGDNLMDAILILKKNGEETTSDVVDHPEKRPLLILTGKADKSYSLAGKNDNTVLCVNCGGVFGDPYNGITIKNGYFSVEHYGGSSWRWTRIITYKYSAADKDWFLHKDGSENFHASNPDKVETVIKTTKDFGKVPFAKFDIYKE